MKNENHARLPHMLGALSHANQYLKAFSMAAMAIAGLTLVVLIIGVTRPPVVLTLLPSGEVLERTALPKAEDQVRVAIRHYLGKRYQWEPATVKQKLQEAQAFILPANTKAYQAAVANVSRFATEKQVSQRVYPEKTEVSLEKKTVAVTGDRITTIQGLRAAGSLNLELSFEFGARSQTNPWGIYITKERELQ
ncbi:MAG TPA: hypothetical protein DCS07_11850 [Bdellovibrionales bacterium]|nr:MAG: hypothetical protein A2Z97_03550 [Bdellovibrionales bacterium GWB1_52_6]OFZ04029.1 MAG: hypothetical protein A2X97_14595 [Bdellovibrionales bacterium GWA1_52_35]OFZ35234.1 MAG: hypothetical protein A2070_04915 [Bdellovibrionales bacterium GWC1_52_8]HAR43302.1 hypothetical protein [Bdellovibrionales bacterium]HCM39886.1 hypothetical protein [Bdellovibrionales bacterium]